MVRIVAALALAFAFSPALAAVNLNTATRDELLAVPGIGPTKAQAILDHRAAQGPFNSVDDLRDVKGFRGKLVERLRPELSVGAAPAKGAARADAVGKPPARRVDAKGMPAVARADAGRIADEKPRK
ncbi:ComE operon protein 1 [Burkholderiales bacterium]|nr:ComE operon protein 1 [Burkholderiales bacterium]